MKVACLEPEGHQRAANQYDIIVFSTIFKSKYLNKNDFPIKKNVCVCLPNKRDMDIPNGIT